MVSALRATLAVVCEVAAGGAAPEPAAQLEGETEALGAEVRGQALSLALVDRALRGVADLARTGTLETALRCADARWPVSVR